MQADYEKHLKRCEANARATCDDCGRYVKGSTCKVRRYHTYSAMEYVCSQCGPGERQLT